MPNEKLPEINEHDAEELSIIRRMKSKKSGRSRLLPGRWTRRVRKAAPGPGPAAAWRKKPVRTTPT